MFIGYTKVFFSQHMNDSKTGGTIAKNNLWGIVSSLKLGLWARGGKNCTKINSPKSITDHRSPIHFLLRSMIFDHAVSKKDHRSRITDPLLTKQTSSVKRSTRKSKTSCVFQQRESFSVFKQYHLSFLVETNKRTKRIRKQSFCLPKLSKRNKFSSTWL